MTGEPAIAAVVCDLGGVLLDAPFDAFTTIEQQCGASVGAVREINSRNADSNAWARIERGEITVDDFVTAWAAEARAAGHQLPAGAVIDRVVSVSPATERADPDVLAALRLCRERGLALALITNNIRPLREDPDAGWLFELFDLVIESCVVGLRKPEPGIYRITLAGLGVAAHEAVMLDDLGINLKPARSLGMRTIKVVDRAAAARELVQLL